jgi:SAM-dependent methyltransferase
MRLERCPVCENELVGCREPWRFCCSRCGYEGSNLLPTINEVDAHEQIDEGAREAGLKDVRVANFARLVDVLSRLKPSGGQLIDVGAAHGWFLEAARDKFEVMGIEPDEAVFNATIRRGLPMRNGYFPDVLAAEEKADVIVFNDVIEHIPAIEGVLDACRSHLRRDGFLLINLPSSQGIFYRVGKILSRVGAPGYFDRLWQIGLPSPHVHYFNEANLKQLLVKCNFVPVTSGRLSVLRYEGLWTRIAYTGDYGFFQKMLTFCGTAILIPFLKMFPSDIVYVAAKPA